MATIPAHDPPVPFLALIPGGLSHGRMIRIKGYMKPYGDRFTINLMCGPSTNPLDDVALHIDVRPTEMSIVRNHHLKETGWGEVEERYGGCPIQPGQPYEILILAQNQCFKIAVNGIHFCEFNHRLPLIRVQYLYICNDTTVSYIGLEGDIPQATAPPLMGAPIGPQIPPPMNYAPNYSPPPPYGMAITQPPIIHQQIQPGPPGPYQYNPNVQLSYGGMPPPYGTFQRPPPPPPPAVTPTSYYTSTPIVPNRPAYVMQQEYIPERSKSNNMLKYAAIAGGAGLTGLALGKILSDSDCCDSD